jgi:Peptidase M15
MPSIAVPLHGTPAWAKLQTQRRAFWGKGDNNVLTPHFKAAEFYCHDSSAPPIVARPGMVKLAELFLEQLRATFGPCFVLSGYRHELYNASIGGARQSQHIYEMSFEAVAADLRFQKGSPAAWAAEARRLRTTFNKGNGGVGRYDRAGFVHVDTRNWQADWSGS